MEQIGIFYPIGSHSIKEHRPESIEFPNSKNSAQTTKPPNPQIMQPFLLIYGVPAGLGRLVVPNHGICSGVYL
jgi:hypothetical protein